MRRFALVALAVSLVAGPFARPASAVSVADVINLQANGLSDEILVALVETDGAAARLTPEDVLRLHQRGVSDRIITAMIKADARTRPVPAPAPVVVQAVIQSAPPPAPAPVIVNQVIVQPEITSTSTSQTVVVVAAPVEPAKPAPPVYWGFGGQARPGSWTPAGR
jgi:hypothetical protein